MAIEIFPDARHTGHQPRHKRTIKLLIDGNWHGDLEERPEIRQLLANTRGGFRDHVTADESSAFPAEANRYHLYVSYACPWAHRTIIYRKLKRLENVISMSVLHPRWAGPGGWRFVDTPPGTIDHVNRRRYLYEVYQAAKPDYTGRVTVPVLWDRQRQTIVNNQSGEIIRMLNSAFDAWGDASVDFYPADLRSQIDELNAWLIPNICAAVYRVGFADSQDAYDSAIVSLFESLDDVEQRLSRQPYLLGERPTESDWHLFATLCRFDAAYFGALKCNLRRLVDYPALSDYTRRMQNIPGVAETVRFDQIKRHYYDAIGEVDPTIVPLGPAIDYSHRNLANAAVDGVGQSAPPGSADPFVTEVLELHEYLENWLKGEVPDRERGPERLAAALAEDFFVIHPTGTRERKADVVRNFASAYGEKSADYALEISDVSVRVLGDGMCLATYRESHRDDPGRTRLSSALLRRRSDRKSIEWLFLQETFVSDPAPS